MKALIDFLRNEDGPTSVEYAVMLAAILMAVIAAIAAVGTNTATMYGDIRDEMNAHGVN